MTIKEENIPEPKEGEIIQNLMEGRLAKNIGKVWLLKAYRMSSVRKRGRLARETKKSNKSHHV